jgi:hypothetical protein
MDAYKKHAWMLRASAKWNSIELPQKI